MRQQPSFWKSTPAGSRRTTARTEKDQVQPQHFPTRTCRRPEAAPGPVTADTVRAAARIAARHAKAQAEALAEQQALAIPVPAETSQFCRERIGIELDNWQVRFLDTAGKRKVLLGSRQCGKSTAVAGLAVHRMLAKAETNIVVVAPSNRQSALIVQKCRAFLRRAGFKRLRGDGLNQFSIMLGNGSCIVALPSSEPTIRGFTAHLLIMDEAAYVSDAIYAACRPMLAATSGELIVMSTANQSSGFFWELMTKDHGDWIRETVRATDISRIDPAFLKEERQALGEQAFAREYNCEFVEDGRGIFQRRIVEAALSDVPPLVFPKHGALS